MAAGRRTLLGRAYDLAGRQRVYATPEGLEVDEVEGWDVTRTRVLFDDVLLVTYHRYLGWVFLLITGLFAGLTGLIALVAALVDPQAGIAAVLLSGFPVALVLFLLRLIFRVDAVTVYGRRTKAQMRFSFRKGRAREVFEWVCERTRRAQEAAAEGRGEAPAGEAGEPPPGPAPPLA